jgi:hypothetical protein
MTTTPAYASPAKEKVITRDRVTAAIARWHDGAVEIPGVGTVIYALILVIESKGGTTDIRVELETEDGNFLNSFTITKQDVFDANSRLTSAMLSPVTIKVSDPDDESFEPIKVIIQATWEGTSDLLKIKEDSRVSSDDFSYKFKGSGLQRLGIAEGSMNDANLGTSSDADISTSKQVT